MPPPAPTPPPQPERKEKKTEDLEAPEPEAWAKKYDIAQRERQAAEDRFNALQNHVNQKDLDIVKLTDELAKVRQELDRQSPPQPPPPVAERRIRTIEIAFTGANKSLALEICSNLVSAAFIARAIQYGEWVQLIGPRLDAHAPPYVPPRALFVRSRDTDGVKEISQLLSRLTGGKGIEIPSLAEESAEAFGIDNDEALIVLR